jgi:hypothetical protein
MLDRDAIHFPKAKTIPSFATAFMDIMFAHAEFEEGLRELQATIIKTPAKQPHVFARISRFLLNFGRKTDDGLGNARKRPKRMLRLIRDRPSLVEDEEAKPVVQILKEAIDPCDQRNLLAHGRWWRFYPKTLTIRIRGERKGESEWADYTDERIDEIGVELRRLALDLDEIKRAIEHRRGDHDF